MSFNWSDKDPDEQYEYTHDWANRLLVDPGDGVPVDVGDSILLPDDADPTKRPTLVLDDGQPDNPPEIGEIINLPGTAKLQYWFPRGSGTPGKKYRFIGTVWTAQGRRYQESFNLKIKER
jgi:hypothetical protein